MLLGNFLCLDDFELVNLNINSLNHQDPKMKLPIEWMQGMVVHFWCHNGVFFVGYLLFKDMWWAVFLNLLIDNWM